MNKNLIRFASFMLALHSTANAGQCSLYGSKIQKIENKVAWIWTKSGERGVRIYNTAVDERGHVWHGGPVEVIGRDGRSICKAELELLEQPFMFARDRYFYFLSGDSIFVSVKILDIKSCEVSWESLAYYRDNPPAVIETESALYLSKKKVPVQDNCLPGIPSATKNPSPPKTVIR